MKKKIILLLAIVAALTLVFVACQEPDTEDTTPTVTEAPTDPTETPTDPVDQPTDPVDQPTDPATTPTTTPETEPETEPETLPYKEPAELGMVGKAVDAFAVNNTATALDETRTVSVKTGDKFQEIRLVGWIGFGQAIESYGYIINDGEFVYDESFLTVVPAGDPVKGAGGDLAERFTIIIPASAFAVGESKVVFVVKLADGSVAMLDAPVTVKVEKTDWNGSGIITHHSQDQVYTGTSVDSLNGPANFFDASVPGAYAAWDKIATVTDNTIEYITYWGWAGIKGEIGQFGYQIDGGVAVYDDIFAVQAEDGVIQAAGVGTTCDNASRLKVSIRIKGLTEGNHTITVLYKAPDTTEGEGEEAVTVPGAAVVLGEFTLVAPAPSVIEPALVIDPRTLPEGSITGTVPAIIDATSDSPYAPAVAAAGLKSAAIINNGSIKLGKLNLGDYSKCVIYYACDWGEGTQTGLADAKEQGYGRLGLSAYDSPAANVDPSGFICAPYTPAGGWVVTAHELTLVAFEGDVYVSADFLVGQNIIIDRIEFYA